MATCTTNGAGTAWNTAANWIDDLAANRVPAAGDIVTISHPMTLNIATVPAAGAFTSITGNDQITVPMATIDANVTMNLGTITPGSKGATGFISVTGAKPALTLTVNGTLAGGGSVGIYQGSTCALVFNGNITGGSTAAMAGIQGASTGLITVDGDIDGGTATTAHGVFTSASSPITVAAGHHIYGGTGGGTTANGIRANGAGTVTLGSGCTVAAKVAAGIWMVGTVSLVLDNTTVTGSTTTSIPAINAVAGLSVTGTALISGGTFTASNGITGSSTSSITLTAGSTMTGGTGATSYGIYNTTGGTVSLTGTTLEGGNAVAASYAVYNASTTAGAVSLIACELINADGKASAYGGMSPRTTFGPTHYCQYPVIAGGTVKLAPEPSAANIKKPVQVGTVTGTFVPTHGIL